MPPPSAGDVLNPRHKRFCEEYILDLNPGRAYRDAGYSPSSNATATTAACMLLKRVDVQAYLDELMAARSARTRIQADDVLNEIAAIAFVNLDDIARWSTNSLELKSSEELSRDIKAGISQVSFDRNYDRDGGVIAETTTVKLGDKLKALGMLAKHLGIDSPEDSDQVKLNAAIALLRKYGFVIQDAYHNNEPVE